jgi:glycerol uptake facilitator-like aquaporin
MEKEWWEVALFILAQLVTHISALYMAHAWTRDHYEDKLNNLRFKARIITGIDVTKSDERWPD